MMASEPWPNRPDMVIASSPQASRSRQNGALEPKGRPRSLVNPNADRSLGGPLEEAALSAIPEKMLGEALGPIRAQDDRSRGG
jgi:hypothetical protein